MTNEIAYAAGLIDGEGCIDLDGRARHGKEPTYRARVTVGMTTPAIDVLKWLNEQWGGSLHNSRKATDAWASAWTWTVQGSDARRLLQQIAPYLRIKSAQARLALEVERIRADLPRRSNGMGAEWNSRARAACAEIKTKMHSLNAKGPSVSRAEDSFLPSPPIATWNPARQLWETEEMDLFFGQQVPFVEPWPTSGMTRSGRLLPLPAWAPPIDGNGSLSSPVLPTPNTLDHVEKRTMHAGGNLTLQGAVGGVNPKDAERQKRRREMLPTPRATDGTKGGPNQRGSSGDLMLPSAVMNLE